MLAEKALSIALIGGASNTKRYLLCRRARSKGGGRTRLITGIALTKPVLRLDPGPVSGSRTTSGLAEELRRGCIVGAGDPSPV